MWQCDHGRQYPVPAGARPIRKPNKRSGFITWQNPSICYNEHKGRCHSSQTLNWSTTKSHWPLRGLIRAVNALLYRKCTARLLHTQGVSKPFSARAPPPSCRWPREGMWVWPLLCNSVHLHYIIFCRTLSIQRQHGVFSFLRAFSPVNPKTGTPLGVPVFRILLSILRPAVSYHRISRSDIVLAAMMTSQQTSGLPARTTARTAAGTARAETDDTALAYPTATSVV